MAVAKNGKKASWLDGIRAFNENYGKMLGFGEIQRIWLGGMLAVIGLAVALLTSSKIEGILVGFLGVFLMI